MLNKIKHKLLFSFLLLSANLALLGGVAYLFFLKAEELRRSENELLKINLDLEQIINNDNIFLHRETTNNAFFTTGHSLYIDKHHYLISKIDSNLKSLAETHRHQEFNTDNLLNKLRTRLYKYNQLFVTVQNTISQRGFKDHGLEGVMRQSAHDLENKKALLPEELLTLRRHEKDFFIRKELPYVEKFNTLCDALVLKYTQENKKSALKNTLTTYCNTFNKVVALDRALGLDDGLGYKAGLLNHSKVMEAQFKILLTVSQDFTTRKLRQATFYLIMAIVISIVLSIIFSIYFSKILSYPITHLAHRMDKFELHNFKKSTVENPLPGTEELRILTLSFQRLAEELQKQFAEIEEKTELLEAQNSELCKVNKELDQFIYSASHDLKAPLSSLLGLVDILEKVTKNPSFSPYFQLMIKSIHKLETHIKDIINYAKSHQLEVQHEKIELKRLLEGIIDMLRFQEGASEVQIDISVSELAPFYCDRIRLNMILFNIISNAFKYRNLHNPFSTIDISAVIEPTTVAIHIKDNGLGIETKHLSRIFQLFYRGTELSTGSGLGLYIAREAVVKLRGEIKVTSLEGVGSEFSIYLPNQVPESDWHETRFYTGDLFANKVS